MREEEASAILQAHEQDGAVLCLVSEGDFRSIKKLLMHLLERNIPAKLADCTVCG